MYDTELLESEEESGKDVLVYHKMRCLEALGQWSELNDIGQRSLSKEGRISDLDKKQKIVQMTARGYWAVGDYEKMADYVQLINANNQEGSFLRAALAIKNDQFQQAKNYINKVRDMFDSELTAMATESYERAYGAMVFAQQLTELEEAIEYKMIPERRTRIAFLWSRVTLNGYVRDAKNICFKIRKNLTFLKNQQTLTPLVYAL
jgi:FKBP12-rapamycin complex-associated protein